MRQIMALLRLEGSCVVREAMFVTGECIMISVGNGFRRCHGDGSEAEAWNIKIRRSYVDVQPSEFDRLSSHSRTLNQMTTRFAFGATNR